MSAKSISSPMEVPFLTCSVKSMWLVKEGSLPSTSPGEWPRPEPRPPTQGNISAGHKTDLVRCGKASSAVGLPRQVSQNPCLREAKNPKTISVSRQRLRGPRPPPPPPPPQARSLGKPRALGLPKAVFGHWSRSQLLIPTTSHTRAGPLPLLPPLSWRSWVGLGSVCSCLTTPRCLPPENALSPRLSP